MGNSLSHHLLFRDAGEMFKQYTLILRTLRDVYIMLCNIWGWGSGIFGMEWVDVNTFFTAKN